MSRAYNADGGRRPRRLQQCTSGAPDGLGHALGHSGSRIRSSRENFCSSPLRPKHGSASREGDRTPPDEPIPIYAATREEVEARRKTFVRKWRLKHRAVADSLQEAGDRLSAFTHLPPSQWRSVRTTNAIERLHEELKRRIKTQTVLPSADTAAMLFWALLASGQMNMRKVDGWQTLATKPIDQPIDLAA